MKFTEKNLADMIGVKPGDKIKSLGNDRVYVVTDNYKLMEENEGFYLDFYEFIGRKTDFTILTRKCKLGELTCKVVGCQACPLQSVCDRRMRERDTLYDVLDILRRNVFKGDEQLYVLFKGRLDKETNFINNHGNKIALSKIVVFEYGKKKVAAVVGAKFVDEFEKYLTDALVTKSLNDICKETAEKFGAEYPEIVRL